MIRLGVFVGVFALMAVLEVAAPRRARTLPRSRRWLTNGTVALRIAVPILAVGMARLAAAQGWGIFANVDWPFWIEVFLAVIVLDMLIYGQHLATHKNPVLCAIHQVHHADRDIDVTTGVGFHPVEIVLSMGYKLICVALVGPPAIGLLIFEVLLNASALFNHANVRLPLGVDRIFRLLVVMPDMHRVHHSIVRLETDSNYGFCLAIWDRLFKTYVDQPSAGHAGMTIGLPDHQSDNPASLMWGLLSPFTPRRSRVEGIQE